MPRRSRKKANKHEDGESGQGQDGRKEEEGKGDRRRNAGGRRGRELQQAIGWFRCPQCRRKWESWHVYRVIGTLKVPYRQACKKCAVKVFIAPYRTRCVYCMKNYCYCRPDDVYYDYYYGYDDEYGYYDDEYGYYDDEYGYYDDEYGYNDDVYGYYDEDYEDEEDEEAEIETHIDDSKPHEKSLCEKCVKSGQPCS